MRFQGITLQHFRNVALATIELAGRSAFFVGANGQGKTSFLEAAGYATALRSFRGAEPRWLIAQGQAEAGLAYRAEHEQLGETRLLLRVRPQTKEVTLDGARVARLADVLGRFPTVVFSSQDSQFVRGSPALRRKWLDLVLAAMDPAYLRALQEYHRALAERNSLLKASDEPEELEAFEAQLVPPATALVRSRRRGLEQITGYLVENYSRLSGGGETPTLVYQPSVEETEEAVYAEKLARSRARDFLLKSTQFGPHRDDFVFLLDGRPAEETGSEGQQRSLVLALRFAQAAYFEACSRVKPVLLADDVLGELDPERRARFWAGLGEERQLLATGTTLPELPQRADWKIFDVRSGAFFERT